MPCSGQGVCSASQPPDHKTTACTMGAVVPLAQAVTANISACMQTRACTHECGALHTPPHFTCSQGTEAKCIFHAMREKSSLFKVHGLECGRHARCSVVCVVCVMGVTCLWRWPYVATFFSFSARCAPS